MEGKEVVNIGVISLGCTKNQVDTEIMQGLLLKAGHMFVTDHATAEVILVNTCGFIEAAKTESIETILTAAGYKAGNCRVLVVAGCLSQRYARELMDEIPEIDAMVGTNTFKHVVQAIEAVLAGGRPIYVDDSRYDYSDIVDRTSTLSYSAYVKVAEGCDNRCSYCAIPLIRGDFYSRPPGSIVDEVKALAAGGVREINLIAQDTTRYGLDLYGKLALPDLLRELLTVEGPDWYRLLYCYPAHITEELLELMAHERRILNYIDLPLQHISQPILDAMGRRGSAAEIRRLIRRMRELMPDIVLRTTFIVGFPGETDSEFNLLRDFVRETQFDHVGVFQYSAEEGTDAQQMADHVPEAIKEQRFHELMSLQQEISRENNRRYLGRIITVLVEKNWAPGSGVIGRAEKDAPDVDGRVFVRDTKAESGDIIKVCVTKTADYDLWGVKADDTCQ